MVEFLIFDTSIKKKVLKKEIEVNRILCGDMYKGVIKLVAKDNGGTKVTDLQREGKPLEYGVKMLQIPQKFRNLGGELYFICTIE